MKQDQFRFRLRAAVAFASVAFFVGCAESPGFRPGAEAQQAAPNSVRFDDQRIDGMAIRSVARGRPGQNVESVEAAGIEHFTNLCGSKPTIAGAKREQYEFLRGGHEFLQPAGSVFFLPVRTYDTVERAPLVSLLGSCSTSDAAAKSTVPRHAIRFELSSDLGDGINFIDQGFASFNRESMEVPLSNSTVTAVAATAIKQALLARGYESEFVTAGSASDVKFALSKRPVPGEQFDGAAVLTKIGLLGIESMSATFCSVGLTMYAMPDSRPIVRGTVSTREMMPAIYSSWASDMSNGPSKSIVEKATRALSEAMSADIKAAIHSIPAETLASLEHD